MRNLVLVAATLLIMATAAFSQKSTVSASAIEIAQKDEQQIRQLEAELLKGEMNSDPAVFEKILADDCLHLPAGPDLTKAKLVEAVRKTQGHLLPTRHKRKICTFTYWVTSQLPSTTRNMRRERIPANLTSRPPLMSL